MLAAGVRSPDPTSLKYFIALLPEPQTQARETPGGSHRSAFCISREAGCKAPIAPLAVKTVLLEAGSGYLRQRLLEQTGGQPSLPEPAGNRMFADPQCVSASSNLLAKSVFACTIAPSETQAALIRPDPT